jgi:hypothetical protein
MFLRIATFLMYCWIYTAADENLGVKSEVALTVRVNSCFS